MKYTDPVTLVGQIVAIRPMASTDLEALFEAAQHEEIWQWMLTKHPKTLDDMKLWMDKALDGANAGTEFPFCTTLRETGEVIGSTRYLEISEKDGMLEIGWTWIRPDHQRTGVNTECKYLLLRHAFETLGVVRVQLKTDGRNTRSQAAILRLGATFEGALRKNRRTDLGFQRDTMYYSILSDEWPTVKANLEGMMKIIP